MASKKRPPQEINASSMADIAFLLLVFFLVTTTMDTDFGIARKLPPPIPPDEQLDIDIKQRNVLVVLANANDQLLVGNELLDVSQLREKTKEFIENKQKKEKLPEWEDVTVALAKQKVSEYKAANNAEKLKTWEDLLFAAEIIGNFTITKQVISLQNDRGTSYNLYIQVQNELAAAYRELRDEMAKAKFGKTFDQLAQLGDEDKVKALKIVYPQKISEAEPKDINK
jgi:biopolymer transport protein ExbD